MNSLDDIPNNLKFGWELKLIPAIRDTDFIKELINRGGKRIGVMSAGEGTMKYEHWYFPAENKVHLLRISTIRQGVALVVYMGSLVET